MGPMGLAGRALVCFAALVSLSVCLSSTPPTPFYERRSHCISMPCRSGRCVDQTWLKCTELYLPLPLRCWE